LSCRRQTVSIIETGESVPMKTPDHVMINAVLDSGAPLSLQLRGGLPRGIRLLWEINGTEGDLRITAAVEQAPVVNISPLRVEGGRKGQEGYIALEIPQSYYFGLEDAVAARNVAVIYRLMADDLRLGTRTAPNFNDALALHKVLSAIEQSDQTGRRVRVG
jgi:predicted dehydrogenase